MRYRDTLMRGGKASDGISADLEGTANEALRGCLRVNAQIALPHPERITGLVLHATSR